MGAGKLALADAARVNDLLRAAPYSHAVDVRMDPRFRSAHWSKQFLRGLKIRPSNPLCSTSRVVWM